MGGGGGSQNTTAEFKPPGYTQQGWQDYLNRAGSLSNVPYSQSGIPTVAPINAAQMTANQMAQDRALNGAPDLNAGRSAAMNAANGAYSNVQGLENIGGIANGQAANPWSEGLYGIANGTNPYMTNQYSEQVIGNNAQNMATAFANGTAAQTDASFAQDGAFGGSAYQQTQAANAAALAQQVGQMASQTREQQRQGNLGAAQSAMGMGSANYNADVGNQLNANSQYGNIWQNNVGDMLSGGALAGNLAADDWTSINAMGQAGNNMNTYQQRLLDSYNNQWNTQNAYDSVQNNMYGDALSRASGSGYGQTTGAGQSPWAGIAGLLGAGAGAYQMFTRP